MNRFLILGFFFLLPVFAIGQQERDTTLNRCPVYITDTLTSNNFFLEHQPSTIRVYRAKGALVIVVEQRDQYFSLFFKDRKLKSGSKYKIGTGAGKKVAVNAKYSFRSGGTASYVNVASGFVEAFYDKEKEHWQVKVTGLMPNMVGRSVTYFRVRADFFIL